MAYFAVLSPIGKIRSKDPFQMSARAGDLTGKRLGLFWNGKHNGDVLLARIAELLHRRFSKLEITQFNYGYEGAGLEAVSRMAQEADLVIGAIGD